MKNSVIPFCDTIPEKWITMPNKYLFDYHSSRVGEKSHEYQLLSLTINGVKEKDVNAGGGKVPDSYDNYQTVEPGDMIFCLFDLDVSAVFSGLSNNYGMITSAYDVARPNEKYLYSKYAEFWFKYVFSNRYYKMFSKNIRFTITSDMFKTIHTPVPPMEKQIKIGELLDKKCSEIDKLIELENKQIENLKEYKQSVITEAVTKGLDKNAKMKDSGVEWIGEIPENWDVVKTKRITVDHLQGYYDKTGYTNTGYRLLRITDLQGDGNLSVKNSPFVKEMEGVEKFVLKNGDFCFARTGGAGLFGLVSRDVEPSVFASYLIRFRFKNQNNIFLKYFFLSYSFQSEIDSLIHGSVNRNVHAENILETHLTSPSIKEQNEIVNYLDKKCSEIDSLIEIKNKKIEELQQCKKSIIYEYVTGKKEVV